MIVGIHQLDNLVWLGVIDRIIKSDVFVVLDTVKFSKNYFHNRNRIRTSDGWSYITVPVCYNNASINDTLISSNANFLKLHRKIVYSYSAADFFDCYKKNFFEVYCDKHKTIGSLNKEVLLYLLDCFGIKTPIYFLSSLPISGTKNELLLNICKYFSADTYLSGAGGISYLDVNLFESNHIKVLFQKFIHPVYKQVYSPFLPCMSCIDLLFNCGSDSLKVFNGIGLDLNLVNKGDENKIIQEAM